MQLTTNNLAAGLSTMLLWLLIAGLIVAFSIVWARKRGRSTLALDVTRSLSLVYVGLTGIGAVTAALGLWDSTTVHLEGPVSQWVSQQQSLLLSPVCVNDTVPEFDPRDGAPPPYLCGGWVENVPFGPRLVIFLGTLLGLVASAAIAWAIYTATRRAGMRDPFHPSVGRTFGIAAIAVMIGGVLGQVLSTIGMTLVARSLEWEAEAQTSFLIDVPLWPFAVAVGLFALSAIFRYGAQLQREKEHLERETEGLV